MSKQRLLQTVVLRSGEGQLDLGQVSQGAVHVHWLLGHLLQGRIFRWKVRCLDYLHLQGEVGLAQEDALAHDAAVLHTDLQVRAVQSPVGVLHPAKMEKYLVVVKNI